MNTVRYYLALLMLAAVPPSVLFWFSIHPFIRFWRRVGTRLTLAIHYVAMIAAAALVISFGRPLLSVDFGTNPITIGLAIPLFIVAAVLRNRFSKHLRLRILTGVPELGPEQHGIPLLTQGIYGRIRHPRYVQFFVALSGYALFCNFLAVYLLVPVFAVLVYCLVRLEEKELRDRYGAEYEAYCARVPRFVPNFRR